MTTKKVKSTMYVVSSTDIVIRTSRPGVTLLSKKFILEISIQVRE